MHMYAKKWTENKSIGILISMFHRHIDAGFATGLSWDRNGQDNTVTITMVQ